MQKTALLLTVWFTFLIFQVNAWGPTGHRVTGYIASKYLSKKASKAINQILRDQSIAIASTWMDEIRADSNYNYTADWHWVTIPPGKTYAQTIKNPNGDIIESINRLTANLKAGKLNDKEKEEQLKMLIHLVGDIHQPLHVGSRDDRGGNEVRVFWFDEASNLHRVWDHHMIEETDLSYSELAASLDTPTSGQISLWQQDDVLTWANESTALHPQVYDIGSGRLGYSYSYKYYKLVRLRLLQAGVRLAGVLNSIYG